MGKRLHVLKDLDVGGIQTVLLDRLKHCSDETIVCIGEGDLQDEFASLGATFITKRFPYLDIRVVWRLRRFCIENNVGEVHAHHTSEGLSVWLATLATDIKYLQYFHVHPAVSNFQDNVVLKFLAKRCSRGVAPTNAQRNVLASCGYDVRKIGVEFNKVNLMRLRPKRDSLRARLGIPNEARLLVSIGNFYNATRDQFSIVQSLPIIFQKNPDVHMVFFGGHTNRYTPHSESYERCKTFIEKSEIGDRVHFFGALSDAPQYLSQCDIFVYATLGDTFGMAVVEALITGIPVVVNDHPVMREVTGGLVPVYATGVYGELASIVNDLLENPKAYPSEKIKEWAQQFQWK